MTGTSRFLTHGVQLMNPEWAPTATATSRAQREQATTTEWDLRALALARTRKARISWWWGIRKFEGQHYATCYLCDHRMTAHLRSHYPDLKG
jgi:hypothetical protein